MNTDALKRLYPLLMACFMVACAGPWSATQLEPGTPLEQVLARLGVPRRAIALPNGGQRLQYSMQPAGQYAWMVDMDAAGKLVSTKQVLNEREFQRIEPGTWTGADVEREFGPPARVEGVASWNGPIMAYRWKDRQGADMFYWVYLDPQGIVRRAHPGMEYRDRFFGPR